MDNETFEQVFERMVNAARETLFQKGKEYASDDDRLHNFKAAGAAQGITPEQALRGMTTKHTVSINDLVWRGGDNVPMSTWNEKIGDEFNYLILLMALIEERESRRVLNAAPENTDGVDLKDVDVPPNMHVKDWCTHPFDLDAVLVQYDDGTYATLRKREQSTDENATYYRCIALGFSDAEIGKARIRDMTNLGFLKNGGRPILFSPTAVRGKLQVMYPGEGGLEFGWLDPSSIAYHGEII